MDKEYVIKTVCGDEYYIQTTQNINVLSYNIDKKGHIVLDDRIFIYRHGIVSIKEVQKDLFNTSKYKIS